VALYNEIDKYDDAIRSRRYRDFTSRKKTFYNTIFHEFGHTLGLIDEYLGTANADMVKRQGDMGAWPPNAKPAAPKADIDTWVGSQLNWANALDEPVCIQPYVTSSIMSSGFQIFKVHYVTAYMALCTLYKETAAIDSKDEEELRNICKGTWAIIDITNA